MRSSTGPMPTISFRSSGLGRAGQDRRRRVVFDVDHQLSIARVVASHIGERSEQSPPVFAKNGGLITDRIGIGQRLPQMGRFAFAAAYDPRLFCADTLGVGAGKSARWIDYTGHRRAGRRADRQLPPAQSIRVTRQRGDGNDSDECKDEHRIGKAGAAGR